MAKFILLEPSLDGLGGHYFEYALHVLGAAEESGFEPVLVANQRFRDTDQLPNSWRVLTCFPCRSGHIHRLPRQYTSAPVSSWRGRIRQLSNSRPIAGLRRGLDALENAIRPLRYMKRRQQFEAGCRHVFAQIPLAEGDHVLFTTVGDLDLLALAQYLPSNERTKLATWHFQFHGKIFRGREPEYAHQLDYTEGLRRRLTEFRKALPEHDLRFYCTTEELASHYNLLEAVPFRHLPYPINTAFHRQRRRFASRPLRVACAGGVRKEKGGHLMAYLAREMLAEYLEKGKMRLLVQSDNSLKSKTICPLSEEVPQLRATTDWQPDRPTSAAVLLVPHPLGPEDYVTHISNTDIGLLLYDSEQYIARCSGILVEMLSAAVPVIVLAGSWLSDQISEPIQRYLSQVDTQYPCVGRFATEPLPCGDEQASGERSHLTAESACPAGATNLLVRFRWPQLEGRGHYLQVAAAQYDEADTLLSDFPFIVRPRDDNGVLCASFRLDKRCRRVRVVWKNAYYDLETSVTDSELIFLDTGLDGCPLGNVGLIAASHEQVPELLANMIDHYDHFKASAEEFSVTWNQSHTPANVVATLNAA